MRCLSLFSAFILVKSSTYALQVDATKFGFTYELPKEWKIIGNSDPRVRCLIAIGKHGKARVGALVITQYVLPQSDLHYAMLNGVPPTGSKFKITESAPFRTASKNVGLRTKIDVRTKDGKHFRQSFYSFQMREWTYLCVSCSGPGDGSLDQMIESIMKSFRLVR